MKKRVNGAWQTKSPLKYGTATDTLTSFPATVIPDGTNASADAFGNMEQSGTPTPTAPIEPSECGERTGNLFDYQTMSLGLQNSYLKSDGSVISDNFWNVSDYIPCNGINFALSKIGGNSPAICFYDSDKQFISGQPYNTGGSERKIDIIATAANDAKFMRFSYSNSNSGYPDDLSVIMLNSGSTALPYEPYGYKIPISSANTTTNVYLGDVQSTRRIKKLVLTGQENWQPLWGAWSLGLIPSDAFTSSEVTTVVCSHYDARKNCPKSAGLPAAYGDKIICFRDNLSQLLIKDTSYSSVTDFQTYLAQQYAAGTPVTVWYILAEPETAILNEPLRNIGDYADSVTVANIPTISGSQTFDVDTTLKPSEADLTYHGWHRIEPKKIEVNT